MIARLRRAYSVPHAPEAHPRRVVARGRGTWMRTLPAAPSNSRFMGAKIFGAGRARTVNYLIVLFEQETGAICAFLDANHITACRTGATSAMAVDEIAPAGPAVVGMLGSGAEAHAHARAIARVRPVAAMRVFSTSAERRAEFATRIERELGFPCIATQSAEAAVREASVVVAAARSHGEKPILFGDWLRPGMVVVSIGSTLAEQREIDASVVAACDVIVCDTVEEVLEETGDMLAAKAQGIAFEHKLLSLSEVVTGAAKARVAGARLPMFKSVGAGVQDVAVAELALERALASGLATELPIEFSRKGM
jgi:ornithine cyclodeaminase/alanine dehydrogenase